MTQHQHQLAHKLASQHKISTGIAARGATMRGADTSDIGAVIKKDAEMNTNDV